MNLVSRFLVMGAAALLLSGCVLKSDAPLFGDTQGALALEPLGKTFTSETFTDGQWKKEEGEAQFTAVGRHYMVTVPDGKEPIELLLVPMEGNRFVGQVREGRDKPFQYVIVIAEEQQVMLSLLSCDELKALGIFAAEIRFEGGDCSIEGLPDLVLFEKMAKAIGTAKTRLRPVR